MHDIASRNDPQITEAIKLIADAAPDILLLLNVDYDHHLHASHALVDLLRAQGLTYLAPFAFAPQTGRPTGLDVDDDGRLNGPNDAQSFAPFPGASGMVLLSRWPVVEGEAQDFSHLLWRDLPGTLSNDPPDLAAVQRLSSVGHWHLPVEIPDFGRLSLLVWHAAPPVFDGPEDRNGRRNHDETRFWSLFLEGRLTASLATSPPTEHFILMGSANVDPLDGDGRRGPLRNLLAHPALHDPAPRSAPGAGPTGNAGINRTQKGDPALDTADWRDDPGPGNLRVQYLLPSRDLEIRDSGILWPATSDPDRPRHGLVWVEIRRNAGG